MADYAFVNFLSFIHARFCDAFEDKMAFDITVQESSEFFSNEVCVPVAFRSKDVLAPTVPVGVLEEAVSIYHEVTV